MQNEEKSVIYFVAQRHSDAAEEFFKERRTFTKIVRQMLKKKKFNFINRSEFDMYDTGDIDLIPQGEYDVLHSNSGDVVFGEILTKEFELKTVYGTRKLNIEEIVNIIRISPEKCYIVGNDGSMLNGSLKPDKIAMKLSDGENGEISVAQVKQLIPKCEMSKARAEELKEGRWFKFTNPIVSYQSGERVVVQIDNDNILIKTDAGDITLSQSKIKAIHYPNYESGKILSKAVVTTIDNQKFSGDLASSLKTTAFEDVNLVVTPSELKAIFFTDQDPDMPSEEVDFEEVSTLQINMNEVLTAEIIPKNTMLEFETAFGKRSFDSEQILDLRRVEPQPVEHQRMGWEAFNAEKVLKQPNMLLGFWPFDAKEIPKPKKEISDRAMFLTLWDGSTIAGELVDKTIAFKLFDHKIELAPQHVQAYHNPNAIPPAVIRQKYEKLIQELGSHTYSVRQSAHKKLKKEKHRIRGLLKRSIKGANAEVQARLKKILNVDEFENEFEDND